MWHTGCLGPLSLFFERLRTMAEVMTPQERVVARVSDSEWQSTGEIAANAVVPHGAALAVLKRAMDRGLVRGRRTERRSGQAYPGWEWRTA